MKIPVFNASAFIHEMDLLAESSGMSRAGLLHRIGASESAPFGWKNGVSKPTVKHCVGLALEEGANGNMDDQVRLIKKWLEKACRDASRWKREELIDQITAFQDHGNARNDVIFENYLRELRRRVKENLLKPRFVDASTACWKAQQAVHAHVDEWLKGSTARAVFHLHEWDDYLSPIMLETEDLVRHYVMVLRQGKDMRGSDTAAILLNLCILIPRDDVHIAKTNRLMNEAIQQLRNRLAAEGITDSELERFGLFKMRRASQAEKIGDLWMYESGAVKSDSFGVLLRSPADLVPVFGQVNGDKGDFDDIKASVLVNPVELARDEAERYLVVREIWRNRDTDLKIKIATEELSDAENRAYKRWRVLILDEEHESGQKNPGANCAPGWEKLTWPEPESTSHQDDVKDRRC